MRIKMSSKRRAQIIIGAIAVVTLCAGLLVYGLYQRHTQNEQLQQLGQLDAERIVNRASPSGELVVEASQFTVYESEIQQVIDRNLLFADEDDALTEQAVLYLTELKAVYQVAVDRGYEISDEELASIIAEERQSVENSSNYKSFEIYIEAMGVTTDEYWDLMRTDPDYVREAAIDRYLQHEKEIYLDKNDLTDGTDEAEDAWNDYLAQIGREAMRQENARIISEADIYSEIDLY